MNHHGLPTSFGGSAMAMSAYYTTDNGEAEDDYDDETEMKGKGGKMPFHGNDRTMNLNPLILANVQGSPYFKSDLFNMKTFNEVVDEIYYKVDHLEPWERGTRKTAGMSQTGMCGGVRGVSAGGVVSSAFCLLYKLHTLKMNQKQVRILLNHADSPYLRALGFMYLRFTLPPGEMFNWFERYLEDDEPIDIKAGGGKSMTIGEFCRQILTKLEWFETRFPRIAVNVEKQIRAKLEERFASRRAAMAARESPGPYAVKAPAAEREEKDERKSRDRDVRSKSRDKATTSSSSRRESRSRSPPKKKKSRSRSRSHKKKKSSHHRSSRSRSRSGGGHKKKSKKSSRSRSRDRKKDRETRDRSRDRDRERRRSRSGDRHSSHKKHKKERKRSRDRRSRDRSGDRR